MTNFVQIIKRCEQASGTGSKAEIQSALKEADDTAKLLITEALDPYRVFGIKKFDVQQHSISDSPSAIASFLVTLEKLSKRELTGNAARTAISETLSQVTAETASYLTRVIDKDLKAGFSAESANKAWGSAQIRSFEVMLADAAKTPEDFDKKISFPAWADWKLDGQRTIAIVRAGQPVEYRARSGKMSEHLNGLFDEELQQLRDWYKEDIVVDGEVFAGDFTTTINAKKSDNKAAKAALKLNVFFVMPLSDWMQQKTSVTMKVARERIQQAMKAFAFAKLQAVPGREVTSMADALAYCDEVIDKHGQEGLIIKDNEATYVWDRDNAWTKVKRFYDADCRVIGFYAGTPKSRLADTLGGLTVRGQLEDGTIVETNVGSGFSDELRNEIWANQNKWLGTTVVVKYQEVSKAKGATVASLRFPVFMHQRDDKIVKI